LKVVELEDMMLITSVHFQCPRNDPQHAAAKHDERLGPVQLVHSGEPQNPDANGRRGERVLDMYTLGKCKRGSVLRHVCVNEDQQLFETPARKAKRQGKQEVAQA
jgi:hypothetical protein